VKNLAIMKSMTSAANRFGFQVKKHSPELLLVTGILTGAASMFFACKGTIKAVEEIEKAKENLDKVHKVKSGEIKINENAVYTDQDYKQDLTKVYAKTGFELAKIYAPAIGFGTLSLVSILSSYNVMHKRNAALAAAYTTVATTLKNYRGRVVERFGEEVDKELKYNIKAEEIEEITTDSKGKEKKVKKTVKTAEIDESSAYARFFDAGNTGWDKDPEISLMFLRAAQQYANDRLVAQGYLFLSDVYNHLGIPESRASRVVGWIYDKNENHDGDNYVDFGIYNINNRGNRDFVNGHNDAILLDFNVDGYILDRVVDKKLMDS